MEDADASKVSEASKNSSIAISNANDDGERTPTRSETAGSSATKSGLARSYTAHKESSHLGSNAGLQRSVVRSPSGASGGLKGNKEGKESGSTHVGSNVESSKTKSASKSGNRVKKSTRARDVSGSSMGSQAEESDKQGSKVSKSVVNIRGASSSYSPRQTPSGTEEGSSGASMCESESKDSSAASESVSGSKLKDPGATSVTESAVSKNRCRNHVVPDDGGSVRTVNVGSKVSKSQQRKKGTLGASQAGTGAKSLTSHSASNTSKDGVELTYRVLSEQEDYGSRENRSKDSRITSKAETYDQPTKTTNSESKVKTGGSYAESKCLKEREAKASTFYSLSKLASVDADGSQYPAGGNERERNDETSANDSRSGSGMKSRKSSQSSLLLEVLRATGNESGNRSQGKIPTGASSGGSKEPTLQREESRTASPSHRSANSKPPSGKSKKSASRDPREFGMDSRSSEVPEGNDLGEGGSRDNRSVTGGREWSQISRETKNTGLSQGEAPAMSKSGSQATRESRDRDLSPLDGSPSVSKSMSEVSTASMGTRESSQGKGGASMSKSRSRVSCETKEIQSMSKTGSRVSQESKDRDLHPEGFPASKSGSRVSREMIGERESSQNEGGVSMSKPGSRVSRGEMSRSASDADKAEDMSKSISPVEKNSKKPPKSSFSFSELRETGSKISQAESQDPGSRTPSRHIRSSQGKQSANENPKGAGSKPRQDVQPSKAGGSKYQLMLEVESEVGDLSTKNCSKSTKDGYSSSKDPDSEVTRGTDDGRSDFRTTTLPSGETPSRSKSINNSPSRIRNNTKNDSLATKTITPDSRSTSVNPYEVYANTTDNTQQRDERMKQKLSKRPHRHYREKSPQSSSQKTKSKGGFHSHSMSQGTQYSSPGSSPGRRTSPSRGSRTKLSGRTKDSRSPSSGKKSARNPMKTGKGRTVDDARC